MAGLKIENETRETWNAIHANRGFLPTAYHGTVGFFSQEVPFAILMATLFMVVGGVIGWYIPHERYTQLPWKSVASAERSFAAKGEKEEAARRFASGDLEFVGRITGMVDCKWSDDKDFFPPSGYHVALGRKYKLDSGLMEITYDTGAKVILQGPVTYEVESANGGFMAVGKLTGKVEVEKAKGFFVRTPTAVVTDLGTEFGVEVSRQGAVTVDVFVGTVEMTNQDAKTGKPETVRLTAGSAATLDSSSGELVRRPVNRTPFAKHIEMAAGRLKPRPRFRVVNVDLVSSEVDGIQHEVYTGQGAWRDPGNDYWNACQLQFQKSNKPSMSKLLDSAGVATNVGFDLSSVLHAWWVGSGGPLKNLFDDYGFVITGSNQPSAKFILSGLNGGRKYHLFLYSTAGNELQGSRFTVIDGTGVKPAQISMGGCDTWFAEGLPKSTDFCINSNYVVFRNLAPDTQGRIVGEFSSNGITEFGVFNGLQLVELLDEQVPDQQAVKATRKPNEGVGTDAK